MQFENKNDHLKVFMDMEFTGLHKNTTLISIGCVTENEGFYRELLDYDKSQIDEWLKENVIAHLDESKPVTKEEVAKELKDWLNGLQFRYGKRIEFWLDCGAYDWVLFCDLWGHAFNIPDSVYYIWYDLCTLMKVNGIDPDVNRLEFSGHIGNEHNAYDDAVAIMKCYQKITACKKKRRKNV